MKGWSQIMNATARDLLGELKRIAPQSPVLIRAEAIFEVADDTGVKPSGRLPTGYSQLRRDRALERLAERDKSDAEAKYLYESGLSLIQVSKQLHRSTGWIMASLARTNTPTRPRGNTKHHPDPERIERFRRMRAEGKTLEEMGAAEHISRERVRQICNAAGIDTSPSQELTSEQKAAVADYIGGGSLNEVAVRHDTTPYTLRNWIIRAGYVPAPQPRKWAGKTREQAKQAAKLYRAGVPGHQIADAIGVSKPEQIYRLLAMEGIKPDRKPGSGRRGLRQ